MSSIVFRQGSGKKDRATFVCGKAAIPAAMVTRLLRELDGLPEAAMHRKFITKLGARHEAFLEALEKAGVSYAQAIQEMRSAAPRRSAGKPRVSKEAEAVARMLCRKYSEKTPEEMLAAFLETTARPEFRARVVELIQASLAKLGRNAQGKIRVRAARKGPFPAAALEKARAARAKKK